MSNLVPDKRPDKDGKVVTRWVKPGNGTPGSNASAIPAPRNPAPEITDLPSEKTLDEFRDLLDDHEVTHEAFGQTLYANVQRMRDETVVFLTDTLWERCNGYSNLSIVSEVSEKIFGEDSAIDPSRRDTVMRNFISMIPPYDDATVVDPESISHFTEMIFDAADGYAAVEPYTEDECRVYRAAVDLVQRLYPAPADDGAELYAKGFLKSDGHPIRLLSPEPLDVLLEHPDRAEAVCDELLQRGTFSAEAVRRIAAAGTLGRGVL